MSIGRLAKPIIGLARMTFREFKNGGTRLLKSGKFDDEVIGHAIKGVGGIGALWGGSVAAGFGIRKVFSTNNKRRNNMRIR